VAAVDALRNSCALLTSADITNTTGIPVGPPQPLQNGCAWRGPQPLAGSVAAADSYTLGGQEGVILGAHVPTGPPASMMCTASIPGIPVPSGVCGVAPTEGGSLAMFQAPGNVIVDIRVLTARPVTQAMLETLARIAYTRAA
jgi:hypothetical protein